MKRRQHPAPPPTLRWLVFVLSVVPVVESGCRAKFVQVDANSAYACALTDHGAVECWAFGGPIDYAQTSPPDQEFTQLATSDQQACGLTIDGDLVCWGIADGTAGDAGQTVNETGPFIEVATGTRETCAIDSEGSLRCWGADGSGNDQDGGADGGGATTHVSLDNTQCAIRASGDADCWPPTESVPGPFASISAGLTHACALSSDGVPTCWGELTAAYVPPNGSTFSQISVGDTASCGVDFEGDITCWGYYEDGSLVAVAGGANVPEGPVAQVATVNGSFVCALRADGGVVCSEAQGEAPGLTTPRYPAH